MAVQRTRHWRSASRLAWPWRLVMRPGVASAALFPGPRSGGSLPRSGLPCSFPRLAALAESLPGWRVPPRRLRLCLFSGPTRFAFFVALLLPSQGHTGALHPHPHPRRTETRPRGTVPFPPEVGARTDSRVAVLGRGRRLSLGGAVLPRSSLCLLRLGRIRLDGCTRRRRGGRQKARQKGKTLRYFCFFLFLFLFCFALVCFVLVFLCFRARARAFVVLRQLAPVSVSCACRRLVALRFPFHEGDGGGYVGQTHKGTNDAPVLCLLCFFRVGPSCTAGPATPACRAIGAACRSPWPAPGPSLARRVPVGPPSPVWKENDACMRAVCWMRRRDRFGSACISQVGK